MACVLLVAAGCGAADFDTWARDVCARNDAIDEDVRTILPKTNIAADSMYRENVQMLLARKTALKAEVDEYQAPFTRAPLQNKLSIALNNSIRFLRALEAQYDIARKDLARLEAEGGPATDPYDVDNVIRELVSEKAVARVDPREMLMKRQYEKLYAEVRAELGLAPLGF